MGGLRACECHACEAKEREKDGAKGDVGEEEIEARLPRKYTEGSVADREAYTYMNTDVLGVYRTCNSMPPGICHLRLYGK